MGYFSILICTLTPHSANLSFPITSPQDFLDLLLPSTYRFMHFLEKFASICFSSVQYLSPVTLSSGPRSKLNAQYLPQFFFILTTSFIHIHLTICISIHSNLCSCSAFNVHASLQCRSVLLKHMLLYPSGLPFTYKDKHFLVSTDPRFLNLHQTFFFLPLLLFLPLDLPSRCCSFSFTTAKHSPSSPAHHILVATCPPPTCCPSLSGCQGQCPWHN